jgi:hypothetical protein
MALVTHIPIGSDHMITADQEKSRLSSFPPPVSAGDPAALPARKSALT